MTDELTPSDLIGTVTEVQATLRDRYGATTAEVNADEEVHLWDHPDGSTEEIERGHEVRINLDWLGDDLPTEKDRSPIVSHVEMLAVKLKQIQRDFPEAEVSTYTDRQRARINLDIEVAA